MLPGIDRIAGGDDMGEIFTSNACWAGGDYELRDDGRPKTWRSELDEWLADIGRWVFTETPFRLGLIGCCLDDALTGRDLEVGNRDQFSQIGLLWPRTKGMVWRPPNASPSID